MPRGREPTQPELWDKVKRRWRATDAGSAPGEWSGRKAVLSQLEYKDRGGRWREIDAPGPQQFRRT